MLKYKGLESHFHFFIICSILSHAEHGSFEHLMVPQQHPDAYQGLVGDEYAIQKYIREIEIERRRLGNRLWFVHFALSSTRVSAT